MVDIYRGVPSTLDCVLYTPGHTIHYIQAFQTWRRPQPHIDVEIVATDVAEGIVLAVDDAGNLRRFRNHDVVRLQTLVDRIGASGTLLGYGVLRLGTGYMVCLAEDDGSPLSHCVASTEVRPARTIEEFAENLIERGGGTFALD